MKAFAFIATLLVILFLLMSCNMGISGAIVKASPSEGEIQACKGMLGSDVQAWQFTWAEIAIGNTCYQYQVSGAGN
jgi:hypothetical protein